MSAMIDLNELRIFVAAAERNSFTRAAIDLGVAQPTISRIVKALEEEWDEPLFYRTGRGVRLSEFGEVVYERARRLLRDADQVSEDLRAMSRTPTGEVALGVPPSMVTAVVPQLVKTIRDKAPGLRLRILEGFSDRIERWLANGSIEVGVFSKYREANQPGEPALFTSPLMLASPPSMHPSSQTIDFQTLAALPLVLPMVPNGLRMIIESVARRFHFPLNVLVDAELIAAQKLVAEQCNCHMIKALHTIVDDQASGRFQASLIVNPTILRYVVLHTTQHRPLTCAGKMVAAEVNSILRELKSDDVSELVEPSVS